MMIMMKQDEECRGDHRHRHQQQPHTQMLQKQRRKRRCSLSIYFGLLVSFGAFQFLRSQHRVVVVNNEGGDVTTTSLTSSIPLPNDGTSKSPISLLASSVTADSRSGNEGRLSQQLQLGPIFYNLYYPSPSSSPENQTELVEINTRIRRIMLEQMEQRKTIESNSTVYITLIGRHTEEEEENNNDNENDELRRQILQDCSPNCYIRESIQVGTEANTIQAMIDYCNKHNSHDNTGDNDIIDIDIDDILVTYIHDKGSYHDTISNSIARYHTTKAAIECRLEMLQQPTKCNICTGKFNIIPQYHASSNMWTAKCSYLTKLYYPPSNYSNAMKEMYDQTLLHPVLGPTKYKCLQPAYTSNNHLGINRYALERYPFSHPYVLPCDVYPIGLKVMYEGEEATSRTTTTVAAEKTLWKATLRRSPTKKPRGIGLQNGPNKHSFARLDGRLFEWKYIYNNTIPKPTSWVWKYYEGGFEHGAKGWLKRNNCTTPTD